MMYYDDLALSAGPEEGLKTRGLGGSCVVCLFVSRVGVKDETSSWYIKCHIVAYEPEQLR